MGKSEQSRIVWPGSSIGWRQLCRRLHHPQVRCLVLSGGGRRPASVKQGGEVAGGLTVEEGLVGEEGGIIILSF